MESTEWYLNNSKYIGRIDENDVLALIVATVMTILDNKGYPERFSDMNRRGAPDTWKIGMLVVRQFLKCSYEMGSEFFGSMKGVLELGGLAAPPHKSTLRKFSYRISKELIDELIFETAHLASLPTVRVVVDGTGFIDTNASPHYLKKAHLMSKSAPADGGKEGLTYCCTAVRGFPKATLAGDVDSLSVYVCDTVTDHSADVTRICPVVDTMDGFGLGVDLVLADKGYDAEYVHVHINEKLKCATIIPARDREPARLGDPKKYAREDFTERR